MAVLLGTPVILFDTILTLLFSQQVVYGAIMFRFGWRWSYEFVSFITVVIVMVVIYSIINQS